MKVKLSNVYLIKVGNYRLFVKNKGAYYMPVLLKNGESTLHKVPGNFLDEFYSESLGAGKISIEQLTFTQMALDGKIEKDSPILTQQSREIVDSVCLYKDYTEVNSGTNTLLKEMF